MFSYERAAWILTAGLGAVKMVYPGHPLFCSLPSTLAEKQPWPFPWVWERSGGLSHCQLLWFPLLGFRSVNGSGYGVSPAPLLDLLASGVSLGSMVSHTISHHYKTGDNLLSSTKRKKDLGIVSGNNPTLWCGCKKGQCYLERESLQISWGASSLLLGKPNSPDLVV